MSEFSTSFADAFSDLLISFGEEVIYHPRAGGTRSITAIVDRNPQGVWVAGEVVVPKLTVRTHNDATVGIARTEIDAGDQVAVALVVGAASKSQRTFSVVESNDGGVTEIAVL